MFELAEESFVDPKNQYVLGLYQSLNQPQISPEPNAAPEPATCHFIMVEAPNEHLYLYVGLFFNSSMHRVLYRAPAFLPEDLPERIAQAEAFAGEMGFMMDDLHYSSANEQERADMIRTIVFFYRETNAYMQALSSTEREAKQTQAQGTMTRETKAEQYSYFLEQYVTIISML